MNHLLVLLKSHTGNPAALCGCGWYVETPWGPATMFAAQAHSLTAPEVAAA